jgi:hypothetical protein
MTTRFNSLSKYNDEIYKLNNERNILYTKLMKHDLIANGVDKKIVDGIVSITYPECNYVYDIGQDYDDTIWECKITFDNKSYMTYHFSNNYGYRVRINNKTDINDIDQLVSHYEVDKDELFKIIEIVSNGEIDSRYEDNDFDEVFRNFK